MIQVIQDKLIVTISKTAQGQHDYIQIASADQIAINIVLIASEIEINDAREEESTSAKAEAKTKSKGPKRKP